MSARWILLAILMSGCGGDAISAIDAAPGGADANADAGGGTMFVYVGEGGDHIGVFTIDETSLEMTKVGDALTGQGPTFLAFDPQLRWLVAVNENANLVESYAIAHGTGMLTKIDSASSQGAGPAHVSLDRSGAYVMVANYGDGTAAVIPISGDGHFGAPTATIAPGANAHEILADAANKTVYVPCLGTDQIAVYGFDAAHGTLTPKTFANAPAGSGPRHLAFAADGKHLWVANEKASTITTYAVAADGTLTTGPTISSRDAANTGGGNTAAEIAVHSSGAYLYVSNRGDDDLGVYAIAADASLTPIEHTSVHGQTPRHFAIVESIPAGFGSILVANQGGSGTVTSLSINPATGHLTWSGATALATSAEFVAAVRVP